MTHFAPNTLLALPAPSSRVSPIARAGTSTGGDQRGKQKSTPQSERVKTQDRYGGLKLVQSEDPSVSQVCAQVGTDLQARLPSPRRGIRADAGERRRYHRSYETASKVQLKHTTISTQIRA